MNECMLYVEDAEDHQFLLAGKREDAQGIILEPCRCYC